MEPTVAEISRMATLEELLRNLLTFYSANARRSTERARAAMMHVLGFFSPGSSLETIDYQALQRYVQGRLGERAAPATIQYELRVLRKGFIEMERAGLAKTPLFPSLKVENIRDFFFEERQVGDVIGYLQWNLAALIRFLSITGWRKGEGTGLRWAQVDFHSGWIRLTRDQVKTRRGRWFPFGQFPVLRLLLREQHEKTQQLEARLSKVIPWVFWCIRGQFAGEKIRDFRKAWTHAVREAGVPDMHVHDLRRTAVRRLIRAGVPKVIAKKLTGHLTDSVFDRYDIVDERDLQFAVRRIEKYFAGGASDLESDVL